MIKQGTVRRVRPCNSATHAKVLAYITEYSLHHRFGPTVREIAQAVGLRSTSTVQGHLLRLERDGYIERLNGKPRTLRLTERANPM